MHVLMDNADLAVFTRSSRGANVLFVMVVPVMKM